MVTVHGTDKLYSTVPIVQKTQLLGLSLVELAQRSSMAVVYELRDWLEIQAKRL